MKLKYFAAIILFVIILFIIIFSYVNIGSEFVDNGTSFDNNNEWIIHNIDMARNSNFTTLSSTSNSSTWIMADYMINDGFIIEWDNHGKPGHSIYCIISNKDKTQETPLSFDDFNLTTDGHIKLIVKDNKITPYINNIVKDQIPLKNDPKNGLFFCFQINNNGSEINYSNFRIHPI